MADTTTPNYGLTLPQIGGSTDTWGQKLNANFQIIDDAITAAAGGEFSAGQITSGVLAISYGGTGADNATTARTNLGLGTMAVQNANSVNITGGKAVLNGSGTKLVVGANSSPSVFWNNYTQASGEHPAIVADAGTGSGAVSMSAIRNSLSNGNWIVFATGFNSGDVKGSIGFNGTSVVYGTSSDYRLKENLAPIVDGVERIKQLPVYRFNFTFAPGQTLDGFLAHEAQAVVPEAVSGEKDQVDSQGAPVYQSIDQGKLVPLLVAAVKELAARVEALEAA